MGNQDPAEGRKPLWDKGSPILGQPPWGFPYWANLRFRPIRPIRPPRGRRGGRVRSVSRR